MKAFIATFGILFSLCSAEARMVTLVVGGTNLSQEVSVSENEIIELASLLNPDYSTIQIEKNGLLLSQSSATLMTMGGSGTRPMYITGPALIRFKLNPNFAANTSMLTVKIEPLSFPPDKTIIIPADTKGARIILESSTNLVSWTHSSPGVFTNTASHLFFRIRAERLELTE